MIKITIATDNAAFADNPNEIGDILRKLAAQFDNFDDLTLLAPTKLRDSNGSTVGACSNVS